MDADGATKGVVSDTSGHVVATVTTMGGNATWHTTRVGAYGPLPTSRAEVLLDAARVAEATAWRGRRADETGFYWLGARYYEPSSGRFLSPDPAGHAASMSLYDYANGDPINQFDPDGRLSVGAWSNATVQQIQKSYTDYAIGNWQGQQAVQRSNEQFWNNTLAGQALKLVPGFSTLAAYQTGGSQAAYVDLMLNFAAAPLAIIGGGARVGVQTAAGTFARVETQALVRTEVAALSRAAQAESSAAIRSRVLANIAENQSATRNIGTGLAEMEARAAVSIGRPATSPNYSVIQRMELRPNTFTASDANHFRQGNRQLHEMLSADPQLAARVEAQYPGTMQHVTPGPRGGFADTSPPGLTWHHHPDQPGVLELVPRNQHQAPGVVQQSLHPGGTGGRQNWGGGR
jgi:RHS repeat-associated protein